MYNYIRHHFPHAVISQSSIPYIANDRLEVFAAVLKPCLDGLATTAFGRIAAFGE